MSRDLGQTALQVGSAHCPVSVQSMPTQARGPDQHHPCPDLEGGHTRPDGDTHGAGAAGRGGRGAAWARPHPSEPGAVGSEAGSFPSGTFRSSMNTLMVSSTKARASGSACPPHRWGQLRLDHSAVGAVLGTVGCRAVSLCPTRHFPEVTANMSPDIANVPWKGEWPMVENRCLKVTAFETGGSRYCHCRTAESR